MDVSILALIAGQRIDGDFTEIPIEKHRALFDTNIVPSLVLARLMADRFLKREKRGALIYSSSS